MIARSVSTLKARQRSPLGARERFAGILGAWEWNPTIRELTAWEGSPADLQWKHKRHHLAQDRTIAGTEYRIVSLGGDHIVTWALFVDANISPLRWYLAELAEHADSVVRMQRLRLTEHEYVSHSVGGTADIVWIRSTWEDTDGMHRSNVRGLSPDDWSVAVGVSPPVADPISPRWVDGVQGGRERLYYHTGEGGFAEPRPRIGIINPDTWEVIVSREMPGADSGIEWRNYVTGFDGNGEWCCALSRTIQRPSSGSGDRVRISRLDHATLEETEYRIQPGYTRGGRAYLHSVKVT